MCGGHDAREVERREKLRHGVAKPGAVQGESQPELLKRLNETAGLLRKWREARRQCPDPECSQTTSGDRMIWASIAARAQADDPLLPSPA